MSKRQITGWRDQVENLETAPEGLGPSGVWPSPAWDLWAHPRSRLLTDSASICWNPVTQAFSRWCRLSPGAWRQGLNCLKGSRRPPKLEDHEDSAPNGEGRMQVAGVGTSRHQPTRVCPQQSSFSFPRTVSIGRSWGNCTKWPRGGSVELNP